jgi:hypothetical protein
VPVPAPLTTTTAVANRLQLRRIDRHRRLRRGRHRLPALAVRRRLQQVRRHARAAVASVAM